MGGNTKVRLKDPKTQIEDKLKSAGYNVTGEEVPGSKDLRCCRFRGENYLIEVFIGNESGRIGKGIEWLSGPAVTGVEIVGDYEFPIL